MLPEESFEGEVMQVATMGQDVNGIPQFGVDIRVKGGQSLDRACRRMHI